MKIIKKRGQNSVKFITTELSFEKKIGNFEKTIDQAIKGKLKKKGKKLIGVLATYRWGAKEAKKDTNNKIKLSKGYHQSFDSEAEADKVYRPGDIKTLAKNKRLKGENYTWKKEFNRKSGKWEVHAYRHLQRGESYFNGFKIPVGTKLSIENIKKSLIGDLTEKYEFYAYERGYDKPYKLRDITINFVYE